MPNTNATQNSLILFTAVGKITPGKFRRLLTFPAWNASMVAIVKSRRYGEGLTGVENLPSLLESYRPKLTAREHTTFGLKINLFHLDLLDRLDRWEAFAELWPTVKGGFRPKDIINKDISSVAIHYIYLQYRAGIIERKLQRRMGTDRIGNLLHAEEYGEAEAQQKFLEIMELISKNRDLNRLKFWPYLALILGKP